MITQECIERIKSAANVVDVIGSFLKLKKEGADYAACCPFHQEKTPSFKVNKEKDMYKCFGCGKSGDSISFLMDHENLSYVGAIQWLADKFNITLDHEDRGKKFTRPHPMYL